MRTSALMSLHRFLSLANGPSTSRCIKYLISLLIFIFPFPPFLAAHPRPRLQRPPPLPSQINLRSLLRDRN
jgi:hypothetical protein